MVKTEDDTSRPEGLEVEEKDLAAEPEMQMALIHSDEDEAGLSDEADVEDLGVALRLRARDIAASHIGVVESPLGTNCQNYSRYFGVGCTFWCGYFLSWAFDRAGNQDRRIPWPAGSTSGIFEYHRSRNWLVNTPTSGDICLATNMQHCSIVRGVNTSTGAFVTIDGNWSDRVMQVARNFRTQSGLYYFARPQLSTA